MSARIVVTCLLAGCASSHVGNPETCGGYAPPDGRDGAPPLYVCATAATDGDGSMEAPFSTLAAALEAAPAGAAVYLSAGVFPESVVVRRAVTLVGGAASILRPPGGPGIDAAGQGDVAIRDLRIEGASTTGIWVRGTRLRLDDVEVRDTLAGDEGLGYGLLASEGAFLDMRRGRVSGSASTGVVVVDGAVELEGVVVEGNADGGVRVDRSVLTAEGLTVLANTAFGVGLVGASGVLSDTTIRGTIEAAGGGGGDGLVIAGSPGPDAERLAIRGATVGDNHRIGVLVDGAGHVELASNRVSANRRGGLWIQGGAELENVIENNEIRENGVVGIALVAAGPVALIDNDIGATRRGDLGTSRGVGDGVSVYDTQVDIVGNRVNDNERLGLILGAATGRLADNVVGQATIAVVLQEGSEATLVVSGTTFVGPATEIEVRGPGDGLPIAREPLETSQ